MIVSHVVREKTAKDLYHPLKYADLEAAVLDPGGKEKVFVHVDYVSSSVREPPESRRQGRRYSGEAASSEDWFELVEVHFHPSAERVISPEGTPWEQEDEPVVLFARVAPLPRALSAQIPRLRAFVAEHLCDRVRKLAPEGLPTERWRLHVALLPESSTLEVCVVTWTDLRENAERIERVELP